MTDKSTRIIRNVEFFRGKGETFKQSIRLALKKESKFLGEIKRKRMKRKKIKKTILAFQKAIRRI